MEKKVYFQQKYGFLRLFPAAWEPIMYGTGGGIFRPAEKTTERGNSYVLLSSHIYHPV